MLVDGIKVDWSRTNMTEEMKRDVIRLAQRMGTQHAFDMTNIPRKRIRRWAREMGTSVEAAPAPMAKPKREEAHQRADDRRLQLKAKLLDRAHDLIDRMGGVYVVMDKYGDRHELTRPPARETKDLAIALGIVADKMRLEMGDVTSKTETITRDSVDDELFKLAKEISERAASEELEGK